MNRPLVLLVLTHQPTTQRLLKLLADEPLDVEPIGVAELPLLHQKLATLQPALVVTDQQSWLPSNSALPRTEAGEPLECGVLYLMDAQGSRPEGSSREEWPTSDLELPRDCSDREIQLTTRLLCENVLLRRQLRREQGVQNDLTKLAHTDPLTGLPNRRAWDERLAMLSFGGKPERGRTVGLVLFDVGELKRINDTAGHTMGDRVLEAVGAALQETLRRDDFAARLGGDEFGAVLFNLPADHAHLVVRRIQQGIEQAASRARGQPVTIAVGWTFTASHTNFEAAFEAADQMLRTAKHNAPPHVDDDPEE